MKLDVGFVGFDGTESKRALLAIHEVKEAEGIGGEINVLLRSPHARARSMLEKFVRMCDVRAFLTDEKDRSEWEKAGARIEGGYEDFFDSSKLIVVGIPSGKETHYVKSSIEHDCFTVLMGGAHRPDILQELKNSGVEVPDRLRDDLGREFFFGLENFEAFQKVGPRLVQCTSCNTTGLCRASLAARPLGLKAVLGNLDRRSGDPHTVVRVSPDAVNFGRGVGHQGEDAGTVFEDVKFSVRASKIPTTVPHVHHINLVFEGSRTPEELIEQFSKTRRIAVIPYEYAGRKHEWTSEILEAFLSGFERPIYPEIFELLVSDAVIPFDLGGYTMLQVVMMVEQMSIAVPNYVEAYLLFAGVFPQRAHESIDKTLGIVHGRWPDGLTV
ncbi:MAG: glyceraldehyde-3-phosphate dehydrogenase [Methanotrichaceae archaeon]|nr:glyceraldehyde-3-phosphate dehydrogenase [Methanotrichaceae archaeon]